MSMNIEHEHGGNLEWAAEIFQKDRADLFDFSSNINPLGIPERLKDILIQNIGQVINYPDPEYKELRGNLSRYSGTPASRIIPGNGSAEIISLLFQALKPEKVLIPAPTFSEYEKSAAYARADVYYLNLEENNNFQLDLERLVAEIANGIDCVILCNPNNPTSTLLKRQELEYLVKQAGKRRTMVVIDEAFIELTVGSGANSMVEAVTTYDNLFIIRAFTKIFAVPGLRLGYGIGPPTLISRMHSLQQPWPVNTLAACAGRYLSLADNYLRKTSTWLAEEKDWLFRRLQAEPKLKVFPPETNFILVKLCDGAPDSETLQERMGRKGILIRDAANFRYLNNRFFRVAIKDRTSNLRLMDILPNELGVES